MSQNTCLKMESTDLSLNLPKIPKDCYYEDYVAALINAGGYYLQRSIHRNINGVELLELDVVATKIGKEGVRSTVIEIKSGGWGIKDIFKVYGWLNFLSIANARGALIVQKGEQDLDFNTIKETAEQMQIMLVPNSQNSDSTLDNSSLKEVFGINFENIHKSVIAAFRYSFALERVMLNYIRSYTDQNPQFQIPSKVYRYLRNLNDVSFTHRDPINRLNFLSSISTEHSYIAAILHKEIKGEGIVGAEEKPNFGDDYMSICFPEDPNISPVYVALHASLMNKLYVLEGIVEYVSIPENQGQDKLQGLLDNLRYSSLNSNIKEAIEELKRREYYYLYPYFWQVFIYVFGGFILLDKKEEEYSLLSKLTGIPIELVEETIYFWDILFPINKGWFSNPINRYSNILYLKMAPAPLCGIGVNFRIHYYADDTIKETQDLFNNLKNHVSGLYTYNDLTKWNNVAHSMLKLDTMLHATRCDKKNKVNLHLMEVETHIKSSGRYKSIQSIEYFMRNKGKDAIHKGFIAFYDDENYDLYIVKTHNKLIGPAVYNIAKEITLNAGNLINGFILDTDDISSGKDNICMLSTFKKINIEELDDMIEISNNKRFRAKY